jgi:hypothetical protein
MKLPGLKAGVALGLVGFAGLPPLRSGRHSPPALKAREDLAGFTNITIIELPYHYFPSGSNLHFFCLV